MDLTQTRAQALARARRDVADDGLHLVLVDGDPDTGTPGFCYTIGLWQATGRPELIVFAPGPSARGMAPALNDLGRAVLAGTHLQDGATLPAVFNRHAAAVKTMQPLYLPVYLGLAQTFYANATVPVQQLFWPDGAGRFPWMDGFPTDELPRQPFLFDDNPLLAGIGAENLAVLTEAAGPQPLRRAMDALFVPASHLAAHTRFMGHWFALLEGPHTLLRVTRFGDAFLTEQDGAVCWLNTGTGEHGRVAADAAAWRTVLADDPVTFFHQRLCLQAKAQQRLPQGEDVLSWRHYPFSGGPQTLDNLDTLSASVHLAHSGELFSAKVHGTEAARNAAWSADDGMLYAVVQNKDGLYSIWPDDQPAGAGWTKTGKTGTKPQCIDYIAELTEDR